jgi:hypothetical protein
MYINLQKVDRQIDKTFVGFMAKNVRIRSFVGNNEYEYMLQMPYV